jgi:hypothetical protein
MKLYTIIVFASIIIVILQGKTEAQISPDWVSYGDTAISQFYTAGIVRDNTGNLYVASGNGQLGSFVSKYNSNGLLQWIRKIKLGIFDLPRGIVIDSFGDIYVGGIRENNTGTFDYTLMKINQNGDSVWARIYDGLRVFAMDEVEAMTIDENDNIYVTGYSHGTTPSGDIVTIKYNTSGDSLWVARYNSGSFDTGYSICVDASGNVIVGGNGQFGSSAVSLLLKYNLAGVLQWVRGPQGYVGVLSKTIAVDNQGNIYLGGQKNFDFYIEKYNTNGDTVWTRTYDESGRNDELTALTVDNLGNLIATGESYSPSTGTQTSTVKFSSSGAKLWRRFFAMQGPNPTAIPGDVKCDPSGNVYVGGAGGAFYLVKYTHDGIGMGLGLFSNSISGNNAVSGVIPAGNEIFISGRIRNQSGSNSFNSVIMKFSDIPTSIQGNIQIPTDYKLEQNFPNPFNPTTTINFSIPLSSYVNLSVYDLAGRKVEELINRELNFGGHNVLFDASNLSSGIYFYKLESGSFSQTRKMILIK